uniref:Exocyst complex component Sec8 n=1 Tax=Schistosoma japonicum TaxID=6182 RepID=Q86EV3_SCHJA|nr:similar to GenBank Accession Number AB051486 KIAA1699 protein in Homo sapiens [Schistosoma japonicum]
MNYLKVKKNQIKFYLHLRNIQLIKALGRLTESLCWLCHRVLNLDTWTQSSKKYQTKSNNPKEELIIGTSRASTVDYFYNSFVSYAKELNRFSEACLLMTYLEVRIQAFNYFGALPEGVTYWCPLDDVDVDKYVTDFLLFIEQVKDLSIHTFSRHKFRFIFDGLGDFISQLLLRLIPQIERMNSNGNKKMCRNIYRLQQALATLTETHESDLIRVKQLYELSF